MKVVLNQHYQQQQPQPRSRAFLHGQHLDAKRNKSNNEILDKENLANADGADGTMFQLRKISA